MAGRADVVCFDKTGTLTRDLVIFDGVVLQPSTASSTTAIVRGNELNASHPSVARALGTCNSLALVDNELVGDPLEKAVMEGVQWHINRLGGVVSTKGQRQSTRPLHRFQFNR